MSGRWLIVGLGNPGEKYERTRHNAGFWFLDELERAEGPLLLKPNRKLHGAVGNGRLHGIDCVVLRPESFMNESGLPVRSTADYFDVAPERIVIAYDDLDLPPGVTRLRWAGGHGGHNGLRSLFSHLGTRDFWRVRIGIGHPGQREKVTPWVLGRASAEDETAIRASIERAVDALPDLLRDDSAAAMQRLHTESG
jgi:PTH1 family peptidyl-tRNA hydrolase